MVNNCFRLSIFLVFSSFVMTAAFAGRDNPKPAGLHFWTVGEGITERFGTNFYEVLDGCNINKDALDRLLLLDRYVIAMNSYRGDQDFASALFKITPESGYPHEDCSWRAH